VQVRRALHGAKFGVLLAQVLERLVHLALFERLGRVPDRQPRILAELDGGLDLYQRLELERRSLLEHHFLEIGLLHWAELRLLERLAVDVGSGMAGDILADVIGEVGLIMPGGTLPLRKPGSPRLLLDALEELSHAS
jgi:hypothetical protein